MVGFNVNNRMPCNICKINILHQGMNCNQWACYEILEIINFHLLEISSMNFRYQRIDFDLGI